MAKITHAETQKKIADALREEVCCLLKWTEGDYFNFLFETGLQYLRFYLIPADDWGYKQLSRSPIFWAWWKNQWSRRDAEFCEPEAGWEPEALGPMHLRSLYYHTHDAAVLASDIYPARVVWDESYNQMIAEFNKEVFNV